MTSTQQFISEKHGVESNKEVTDMARQLDSTSIGSGAKQDVKVEYRGEFRLIGVIVNNPTDKNYLGYVVMNEKTRGLKAYNVQQLIWLLTRYKFVNAKYEPGAANDGIVNTECALNRLIKFNTNLRVVDNNKIIILGEIYERGKHVGYRIYSSSDKIIDATEVEILKLVDKTKCEIVNAKITNNGAKSYISGIKSDFLKIEVESAESLHRVNTKEEYRKEAFKLKLIRVLGRAYIPSILTSNKQLSCSFISSGGRYKLKTAARVLVDELLAGCEMTAKDKELLNKLAEQINTLSDDKRYVDSISSKEKGVLASLAQFALYIPEVQSIVDERINNGKLTYKRGLDTTANKFITHKIACSKLVEYAKKTEEANINIVNKIEANKKYKQSVKDKQVASAPIIDDTSFKTAHEIAGIGFCITGSNHGYDYTNKRGAQYKLQFIGSKMDAEEYSRYLKLSSCFGDIFAITLLDARLQTILGKYDFERRQWHRSAAEKERERFWVDKINNGEFDVNTVNNMKLKINTMGAGNKTISQDSKITWEDLLESGDNLIEALAHMEILLALIAMYNPKLAKAYIDDHSQKYPKLFEHMLPAFDFENTFDFKLNPKLNVYYESGFNVYKMCDTVNWHKQKVSALDVMPGPHRRAALKYAVDKYDSWVNFYKMSIPGRKLIHKDFDELATVIGMVTSDICTMSIIEDKIGILRCRSYEVY